MQIRLISKTSCHLPYQLPPPSFSASAAVRLKFCQKTRRRSSMSRTLSCFCSQRSLAYGAPFVPVRLSRPCPRLFATSAPTASLRQTLAAWLSPQAANPTTDRPSSPESSSGSTPPSVSTPQPQSPPVPSQQVSTSSPASKVAERDASLMRQMQDREGLSPGDSSTSDHLHGAMGSETRKNLFRYVPV